MIHWKEHWEHGRFGFTFRFHDTAEARFWGSHRSLICPLLPSGAVSALLQRVVVGSASENALDKLENLENCKDVAYTLNT